MMTTLPNPVRRDPQRPGAQDSREDLLDLRDILRIIRRRKFIILIVGCLGTALTLLAASLQPPRFTATAAVAVEPASPMLNTMAEGEVQPWNDERAAIETQLAILSSRSLARRVVLEYDLTSDPEFVAQLKAEPASEGASALNQAWRWFVEEWLVGTGLANQATDLRDTVKSWIPTGWQAWPDQLGEVAEPSDTVRDQGEHLWEAVDAFITRSEVRQQGRSRVLSINFTSVDPIKASRMANAIAEQYIEDQLASKQTALERTIAWLQERVERLRTRLLESEQGVEAYRAENRLVELERGLAFSTQELSDLNKELIVARSNRAAQEARLQTARELGVVGGGYEALTEVQQSPIILSLRQQEAALRREQAELSREYGPRHPKLVQLQAAQRDLAAKLDQEIQNIIENLENEVTLARSREAALEESLEQASQRSMVGGQAQVQLSQLEREADASRSLYERLLNQLKVQQEQQDSLQPDAWLVSPATPPRTSNSPSLLIMAMVGLGGSVTLGTALAFLIHHFDRGLSKRQDIEEVLDLPLLGLIPHTRRLGRRRAVTTYLLKRPGSAYAEAVRALRTEVQQHGGKRPSEVFLVTSALPGEGKTTLAVSLCASAAASGEAAVIIDLDLRHPSVEHAMRRAPAPGIGDYVSGKRALDDIIHVGEQAGESALHYVPVGRRTRPPSDVLNSPQMDALFAALRQRYTYLIIDAPPLLGLADAKVAARWADTILFAVRWGKTTGNVAFEALTMLNSVSATVAGAVFTQVDLDQHLKFGYNLSRGDYKRYKALYDT